jgi:hypothetical protein
MAKGRVQERNDPVTALLKGVRQQQFLHGTAAGHRGMSEELDNGERDHPEAIP